MVGSSGAMFPRTFAFGKHQDILDSDTARIVDVLAGCCQVFRRDLRLLGVELDGKFWVEDADFSFQIRQLGKRLLLIPQQGLVNHVWGGSGNEFAGLFEKNWKYFTNKWRHCSHLCSV